MANIQSQVKRNRQNERAHERNKAVRSALKTELKKFHTVAGQGDAEAAATQFRAASRRLDKAATKGVVHSNYAANKKSKMARKLAEL